MIITGKTIGIITVLYNSEHVLDDFFKSLSLQTYKDFVLYIVDNKSPDDALNKARSLASSYDTFFSTVIIANNENYGVAKGNNIGIKQALNDGCKAILLSNNDIVMKNNCIETLLHGLNLNKWDMVTPKIFFYGTELIWFAGGSFSWRSGGVRHWNYKKTESPEDNKEKLIEYAPTCSILIKKEVFDSVGFFDEKYFVYYDDTDWLYRCKKKKIKVGYFPEAVLWHKESTSTGGMLSDFYLRYDNRNKVYFCRKHFSIMHTIIVLGSSLVFELLKKSYDRKQRGIIFKAFKEGFKMKVSYTESN